MQPIDNCKVNKNEPPYDRSVPNYLFQSGESSENQIQETLVKQIICEHINYKRHLNIYTRLNIDTIVANLPYDIGIWVFSRILTRTCDLFKTGFNEEMSKCSELN